MGWQLHLTPHCSHFPATSITFLILSPSISFHPSPLHATSVEVTGLTGDFVAALVDQAHGRWSHRWGDAPQVRAAWVQNGHPTGGAHHGPPIHANTKKHKHTGQRQRPTARHTQYRKYLSRTWGFEHLPFPIERGIIYSWSGRRSDRPGRQHFLLSRVICNRTSCVACPCGHGGCGKHSKPPKSVLTVATQVDVHGI